VSHRHRKTTTLVAGLRKSGMVAPMTLDGPIDGDWFEAYVRHILLPARRPGDVVIMDNLSSHKRVSVREMIESAGARLMFLQRWSWVEPLGATLIGTSMPSIYGQLQTGVGDGTILVGTSVFSLTLYEQTPFITKVNTGPLTFGGFGMNSDVYDNLPEDVQQVLTELGRDYSEENARIIESELATLDDRFRAGGATVTEMPLEQKQEWADRLPDLGKAWVDALAARGIPAADIMKRYIATARAEGAEPLRDWSANV
jgi:hypothetical protein